MLRSIYYTLDPPPALRMPTYSAKRAHLPARSHGIHLHRTIPRVFRLPAYNDHRPRLFWRPCAPPFQNTLTRGF